MFDCVTWKTSLTKLLRGDAGGFFLTVSNTRLQKERWSITGSDFGLNWKKNVKIGEKIKKKIKKLGCVCVWNNGGKKLTQKPQRHEYKMDVIRSLVCAPTVFEVTKPKTLLLLLLISQIQFDCVRPIEKKKRK